MPDDTLDVVRYTVRLVGARDHAAVTAFESFAADIGCGCSGLGAGVT